MTKTHTTTKVAPSARLKYWNDLHANLRAPVEIKALNRADFAASTRLEHIAQLRFVKTESTPAIVEHRARHVAQTKERRFRLLLAASGTFGIQHLGRELVLRDGDFTLLDDSAPYRLNIRERHRALCLAITPNALRAYLPAPARFCGLAMPIDRPLNRVVSSMLLGLWNQVEAGLPPPQQPGLTRSLLQVLASAYALEHSANVERSVSAAARLSESKQYIEANLRSAELGPTTIAAALGLSRRYLRLLFAGENDSVTAYIRRRRLEECATALVQPLWQGRSITAIAADWGFRSTAHFARAFRKQYGTSPTAYKREGPAA